MDNPPWVTITHTGRDSALQTHPRVLTDLPISNSSFPQFVSFVGKHEKSHVLRELLLRQNDFQVPHGQVYLWPDPITRSAESPIVFIDCELHSSNSTQWKEPASYIAPELSRKLSWLSYGDQAKVRTYFTTNVLFPMSTIIYYFAADLGGTAKVIELLVQQLSTLPYAQMPHAVLPMIVVITDDLDHQLLQDTSIDFNEKLLKAFTSLCIPQSESEAKAIIKQRFGSIQAISSGHANRFARTIAIREHMRISLNSLVHIRRAHRHLFSFPHLQAFSTVLLEQFCSEPVSKFSFIEASRPMGFDASQLAKYIQDILQIMPSEAWLWHFVVPMVASCILVSIYPPGSHCNSTYPKKRKLWANLRSILSLQSISGTVQLDVQPSHRIVYYQSRCAT